METTKTSTQLSVDFKELISQLNSRVLGQEKLLRRLLIALIADGHLLVEGAPGLAKTTSIKYLADHIEGDFHRIQFTPDLLPSDITGTEIYRPNDGSFQFQKGPIFHNLILADEINRAPAKVQSALLEAMGERQVSYGNTTFNLPELFLVMATQNPIEQEGTYPLPEAQLDRFLMYVKIDYPSADVEKKILELSRQESLKHTKPSDFQLSQEQILHARKELFSIHLSDALENYLIQLVLSTRNKSASAEGMHKWISFGASPRATISLDRCARANAWLEGRDYVIPEDIHEVVHDVLRHRIVLSFEAEAEGVSTDDIISELLKNIGIP